MPFIDSTVSKTVSTGRVYGPSGYSYLWAQCTVEASTSGDTVSYTVTMTNGNTSGGTTQPKISLWVGIDSQTVVDAGYYGSSWSSFPLKNNSTKSGSITTTTANDTSIPVSIKLLVSQDYKLHDVKWDESLHTEYLTRTWYTNGSISTPTIKDNGNNTFTLSASYSAGTNNSLYSPSSKIYYTTNGSTPTTSSTSVALSGGTISISSSSSSYIVRAFAYGVFSYNIYSSDVASKTVYYYSNGAVPATPTITDKGNNKFTISGKVSKAGTNNPIKTATLYYKISSSDWKTKTLTTTSEGSYSFEFDVPSGSATPTIRAQSECTFGWGSNADYKTRTSGEAVTQVKYYTTIGKPGISIKDNYNNTFTVSGTAAANGTNNTASTSYVWGYSTSYGNSGTGTKNLTIATNSNATRTVYAKATASPSWSGDSAKTATASLAIKQYVAPGNPGTPVLSYTRSRLTIKENWKFDWTAASAANSSSPVKGYRIAVLKNGTSIPIKNSSGTVISSETGTNWYTVDTESTTFTLDPVKNGFAPGDTIRFGVKPYTKYGSSNTGTQLFNSSYTYSSTATVKNAGITHVKVSGTWKEGQVYIKVNGAWKEAETVNIKAGGSWKESQ